jgi:hypothetical protein
MTRYLVLFDSYGLVLLGRPLWWENGSVFWTCCWSLPAQFFSGPSPLGLATIFYCLRFETSFLVASYDWQGHGGPLIRPRYIASARTALKIRFKTFVILLGAYPLPQKYFYPAVTTQQVIYFGSIIPAFRCHVKYYLHEFHAPGGSY